MESTSFSHVSFAENTGLDSCLAIGLFCSQILNEKEMNFSSTWIKILSSGNMKITSQSHEGQYISTPQTKKEEPLTDLLPKSTVIQQ